MLNPCTCLQSEVPLPARIVEVWDRAFYHVDYSAYGIARLDEIVETTRIQAAVKFCAAAQLPAASTAISSKTAGDEEHAMLEPAHPSDSSSHTAPADQLEDVPTEDPKWKEVQADFKKTRTAQVLDQKQQELQRLQVI